MDQGLFISQQEQNGKIHCFEIPIKWSHKVNVLTILSIIPKCQGFQITTLILDTVAENDRFTPRKMIKQLEYRVILQIYQT